MKKGKILNTQFTSFNKGDIIDVYSVKEVLEINMSDRAREWIEEDRDRFVGFCLSCFNPLPEGGVDFTGLYKEDVELQ